MTVAPPDALDVKDPRDANWVRVGSAIKDDRQRRGWSRTNLIHRATGGGQHLTERTLALIEQGRIAHENMSGASLHAVEVAYTALGWTADLCTSIRSGADLPPLAKTRAPRRDRQPAASMTAAFMACHPDTWARLETTLTECVESVRAELIRRGMALTTSQTDPATRHAVASRMARHLVSTCVLNTLAEVEDNDYTTQPH